MLMTIAGLITAFILLVVSFWTRQPWLKYFVLGGLSVWFTAYAILLLTASVFSQEKVLGLNEPKEFCGFYFDCHLRASVSGVRTAKEIGDAKAQSLFYIVKVRISSDAKRESLQLTDPDFEVLDDGGRIYTRISAAEENVESAKVPFDQKVPAGGSFEKEIVFDITEPAAQDLKLSITDTHGIDQLIEAVLIDDEDSIGHKRTFLKLNVPRQTANLR